MSSSQILQRSIVREKLKAAQPDIYIDVEVDEFYVLEFHRFKEVLAAAGAGQGAAQAPARPRAREPDRRDAAGRRGRAAAILAARKRGCPASSGCRGRDTT